MGPWAVATTESLVRGRCVLLRYLASGSSISAVRMDVAIFCAGPSGGMADATDSKSVGGNPMRVRLSPRASALMLFIPPVYAQLGTAQQPSLRGTVVSAESGAPLGFSIVSLRPNAGRQFTDSAGVFAFAGVAGRYVLSVRQI